MKLKDEFRLNLIYIAGAGVFLAIIQVLIIFQNYIITVYVHQIFFGMMQSEKHVAFIKKKNVGF